MPVPASSVQSIAAPLVSNSCSGSVAGMDGAAIGGIRRQEPDPALMPPLAGCTFRPGGSLSPEGTHHFEGARQHQRELFVPLPVVEARWAVLTDGITTTVPSYCWTTDVAAGVRVERRGNNRGRGTP